MDSDSDPPPPLVDSDAAVFLRHREGQTLSEFINETDVGNRASWASVPMEVIQDADGTRISGSLDHNTGMGPQYVGLIPNPPEEQNGDRQASEEESDSSMESQLFSDSESVHVDRSSLEVWNTGRGQNLDRERLHFFKHPGVIGDAFPPLPAQSRPGV